MKTYNHPHWSEGSWDEPIITDLPDIDDILRDGAEVTEPGEFPESRLPGIVEVIGGIVGEIVQGIGNILGGVWEAGTALLGPVVEGVGNFIEGLVTGVANLVSSLFGGGRVGPPPVHEIEEEPVWSLVKADLEGALQPHFDRIDEGINKSEENSEEIQGLLGDMTSLREEQEEITSRIDGLNTTIGEQIDQKLGPINSNLQNINGRIDNLLAPTGEIQSRMDQLASSLEEEMASADEAMKEYLEGPAGKLWPIQQEWNNTQSDLNVAIRSALDMQKAWNGEQSNFNDKITETLRIQAEWNDEVTGWIKTQNEINRINEEVVAKQEENDTEYREMFEQLTTALNETTDYVARVLPIKKDTPTENDHFRVTRLSNGNWRVRAKGNWVGEFVWQGVWNAEGAASIDIRDVGTTRQWDLVSFYTHASVITYWIREGRPVVLPEKTRSGYTPPRHLYHNVFEWTAPAGLPDTTMEIFFRVGWDAATADDWYGIRATKNLDSSADSISSSYKVGEVIKRTGVGPTFPGMNGYRTMTIAETNIPIKGGDTIRFQAHCSASQASQRRIRTAWLRISYIDPAA